MVNETQNEAIRAMVQEVISREPEYFLVNIKIKPTHNVKVYLDGDHGISIEKCVQFNRALYKKIEANNLFPAGDFSLELSSPGLDEPLKLLRQYRKNAGRAVEVILLDGSTKQGKMTEITEDGIVLEEQVGKNKQKHSVSHSLLFNEIKSTRIHIVF